MTDKKVESSVNVDLHIGGDVGNGTVIGHFSHISGDIGSNNTIISSNNTNSPEQQFLQLSQEFLKLLDLEKSISKQDKEEIRELIETNQDAIRQGKVKKAMMRLLNGRLGSSINLVGSSCSIVGKPLLEIIKELSPL